MARHSKTSSNPIAFSHGYVYSVEITKNTNSEGSKFLLSCLNVFTGIQYVFDLVETEAQMLFIYYSLYGLRFDEFKREEDASKKSKLSSQTLNYNRIEIIRDGFYMGHIDINKKYKKFYSIVLEILNGLLEGKEYNIYTRGFVAKIANEEVKM